jgi:hypothetical protein
MGGTLANDVTGRNILAQEQNSSRQAVALFFSVFLREITRFT